MSVKHGTKCISRFSFVSHNKTTQDINCSDPQMLNYVVVLKKSTVISKSYDFIITIDMDIFQSDLFQREIFKQPLKNTFFVKCKMSDVVAFVKSRNKGCKVFIYNLSYFSPC